MGKIAVGEGKGKEGGVGKKRDSGVFFWSSRGKKLLEDEEKNKFCLPKALSIFFCLAFSLCLPLPSLFLLSLFLEQNNGNDNT